MNTSCIKSASQLRCEQLETRLVPTIQAYVDGLYRDVVFRVDDTSPGNEFWEYVATQPNGYNNVAEGFWQSPEHRHQQIRNYYLNYLDREPENLGTVDAWYQQFQAGATEVDIRTQFLSSQEYMSKKGTGGDFINAVYQDVLGRAAGAGEISFWSDVRASSGSANMVRGILTSSEANEILLTTLYANYFNRQVDATGRAVWLAELNSGRITAHELAIAILTSEEYANMKALPSSGLASASGSTSGEGSDGTVASSPDSHNVDMHLKTFAI